MKEEKKSNEEKKGSDLKKAEKVLGIASGFGDIAAKSSMPLGEDFNHTSSTIKPSSKKNTEVRASSIVGRIGSFLSGSKKASTIMPVSSPPNPIESRKPISKGDQERTAKDLISRLDNLMREPLSSKNPTERSQKMRDSKSKQQAKEKPAQSRRATRSPGGY